MSRADETVTSEPQLTPRERQVLLLMTEGHVSKSIGRELSLSSRTVEIYSQRVVKKLGACSGTNAVAIAISTGIIPRVLGDREAQMSNEEFIARYSALEAENKRLRKALGHIAETAFVAVLTDCKEDAAEEQSKSVTGTKPREGTTTT